MLNPFPLLLVYLLMELKDRIGLIKGDITKVASDVIVNAANSSLMGGGGVDGAIHRAGGKRILEECMELVAVRGSCPPGEAVITTAGNLQARYVIHTVGPVWSGGNRNEREILRNCYLNALALAVKHDALTVAFPNISTGIYRFPKEEAAKVAFSAVTDFLKNDNTIEKVCFVCFDEENYTLYDELLNK